MKDWQHFFKTIWLSGLVSFTITFAISLIKPFINYAQTANLFYAISIGAVMIALSLIMIIYTVIICFNFLSPPPFKIEELNLDKVGGVEANGEQLAAVIIKNISEQDINNIHISSTTDIHEDKNVHAAVQASCKIDLKKGQYAIFPIANKKLRPFRTLVEIKAENVRPVFEILRLKSKFRISETRE